MHISDTLGRLRLLTELDLCSNALGQEEVLHVSDALARLDFLTAVNIDLDSNPRVAFRRSGLFKRLRSLGSLDRIIMMSNEIGDVWADSFSAILPMMPNIKSLSLGCNQIGPEGARALSNGLGNLVSLTTLILRDNNIGSEGAEWLSSALCKLTSLDWLNLDCNNIHESVSLGSALSHLKSLRVLSLCKNGITARGITAIADGIKEIATIEKLHLDDNNFGFEASVYLLDSLKNNTVLYDLDMDRVNIFSGDYVLVPGAPNCDSVQHRVCSGLAISLAKLKAVKYISMRQNGISFEWYEYIRDVLRKDKPTVCLSTS